MGLTSGITVPKNCSYGFLNKKLYRIAPSTCLIQNKFSNWNDGSDVGSDLDEMSDGEISKLVIVTQTPSRPKKHDGFDRTGDYTTRTKLSQVLYLTCNHQAKSYLNKCNAW